MLQCDFEFHYSEFSLNIQLDMQDQLLGIIGESGSGKSTFLKNLVGLLAPNDGNIILNQHTLFDAKQQINLPMHQRKIALIFQKATLFQHMNVEKNLRYAENFAMQSSQKFSFDQIVELLELKSLIKRKAYELSGGEAQRVSIGRALLSSPDLLLLDEPLTGLDRRLKSHILPFLMSIKEQTQLPMIYVTHHLEEIEYLQAPVLCFEKGRIMSFELPQ